MTARDPGAVIRAIWNNNREEALSRVALIEDAVAALIEDRLGADERREAERAAHKLAGSSGTFGFHQASEAARQLEHILKGAAPIPLDRMLAAADGVVALRTELSRGPGAPAPAVLAAAPAAERPGSAAAPEPAGSASAGPDSAPRTIVVSMTDRARREQLITAAATRTFEALVLGAHAWLPEGGQPPVAALVEIGAGDVGIDIITRLRTLDPPVPTLALTPPNAFSDRVAAARAGALGFIGADSPPEGLVSAVQGMLSRTDPAGSTVLAVDDDPAILSAVDAVLAAEGLRTVGLGDPLRFWEVLEEVQPDLVVLDLDMLGIRGDELCRVLRSDGSWAGLPVLFLTGRGDPESVANIFDAGADDFVTKPFSGPELVARIRNQLKRNRLLREIMKTDSLTGLSNRRHAESELQRMLALAERHGQPLSLVLLDLDRFKAVNDSHGHTTGDDVLRRFGALLQESAQSDTVAARWSGEEFLLGMFGMARDDAVDQMASILELLGRESFMTPDGPPITVSFSAGVASYPQDALNLQELFRAADRTMYRAKEEGRRRVLSVESASAGYDIDVAVVEDDPLLAELLGHALTTYGYRYRHFADGRAAADQLAGSPAALRARVVLLDVDLPILNGLGVLREMASTGNLADTRVIMLTARSSEQEIVDTLKQGAFDHVAKPFSVPVLMQRLRRALSS
ncbi:response regulator [Arthrobacter sp. TMN-50]